MCTSVCGGTKWIEQNSFATLRRKLVTTWLFHIVVWTGFLLILDEANCYLWQELGTMYGPSTSAMQDVKMKELHRFLVLTVHVGHDQRDSIRDYWSRDKQQTTSFFISSDSGAWSFSAYSKIFTFCRQLKSTWQKFSKLWQILEP
jgi:hypothetical protein